MKRLLTLFFVFTPMLALAAPQNFQELVNLFLDLINAIIPVIVGLSILVFFRGLALFIWSAGDSANHEKGKSIMIWGLVGLFVMFSVWSILRFAYGDFGFSRSFGVPFLRTGSTSI